MGGRDRDGLGQTARKEADIFSFPPPEPAVEQECDRATGPPPEATTWRLEALLEAYGYHQPTVHARTSVEESLRREGWAVDPPLPSVAPRTDVWVYPISGETSHVATGGEASPRLFPLPEQAGAGLGGWQKVLILAVCALISLGVLALVLSTTGNLSKFRLPADPTPSAKYSSPIEKSFGDAYEEVLDSQDANEMRLEGVRCMRRARDRFRCEAMTKVVGSGSHPDQFELTVGADDCWRADPLAPNLIDTVIEGCD
jgi:hypothetical protein